MNKKLVFVVLAAIVILALGSFGVAYAKSNAPRNNAPACGYQNCPNGGVCDGSTCSAQADGTCDGNGACGVNAGQGNQVRNANAQGNGACGYGNGNGACSNGQGNGNGACGFGQGNGACGNGQGNGAGACGMGAY